MRRDVATMPAMMPESFETLAGQTQCTGIVIRQRSLLSTRPRKYRQACAINCGKGTTPRIGADTEGDGANPAARGRCKHPRQGRCHNAGDNARHRLWIPLLPLRTNNQPLDQSASQSTSQPTNLSVKPSPNRPKSAPSSRLLNQTDKRKVGQPLIRSENRPTLPDGFNGVCLGD